MMEKVIKQTDEAANLENKSDSLRRSLGRLSFDIESMKRVCDSKEEIDELRLAFFDLLQEYRNIQKEILSEQ
jgi:hypothetical protein